MLNIVRLKNHTEYYTYTIFRIKRERVKFNKIENFHRRVKQLNCPT